MGGGPPASRPRRELRSARRLEARPGPATAHGHRSQAHQSLRCPPHQWGRVADVWLCASSRSPARPLRRPPAPRPALAALIAEPTPNFARNSPTTASSFELRSLELQRFPTLLNLLPIELRATFWGSDSEHHHGHRSQASPPASRPHKRDKIRPARLKPMTPMRVAHCQEMKPPTPLRSPCRTRLKPLTPLLAQKSQFQAVFRPQRCHGFRAPLAKHPQRR